MAGAKKSEYAPLRDDDESRQDHESLLTEETTTRRFAGNKNRIHQSSRWLLLLNILIFSLSVFIFSITAFRPGPSLKQKQKTCGRLLGQWCE